LSAFCFLFFYFVARMSAAKSGNGFEASCKRLGFPGYRFAHPGYAASDRDEFGRPLPDII